MTEDILWKLSDETIKLRKEMQDEVDGIKEILANGSLLAAATNEKLVRDYCVNVGKVQTLNVLIHSLKVNNESED